MQRHSQETRDRYFEARARSETSLEAANEVGVPYDTVLKWDQIKSQTGSTKPKKRKPSDIELYKDEIEAHLVAHGRITLPNLARDMKKEYKLEFDSSTYSRHLKKWGWEKVERVWCKPEPAPASKQGYGHRNTKHSAHAGAMATLAVEGCSAQEIADILNEKFKPKHPISDKVVDYHVRKQGIPLARRKRSKESPTTGKSETAEQSMPAKQTAPAPGPKSISNTGRSEVEKPNDPDWKVFRQVGRMRSWRKSNPDISSADIAAMLLEYHGVSTTAEVVDRVLEVRVLSRFAGTIMGWFKNEKDMTLDEAVSRLKDYHNKDTARSTVSLLLRDYGVELQRGRKPKEKEGTRLLVENGKREVLPPKQEPKGASKALINAVRNVKMPTVDHLRVAASGFVKALKKAAETAGFTDPRDGPNVQYCIFTCLALLMVAVSGGNKDLHSMVLYLQSNGGILKRVFGMKKIPSKQVFDYLLQKMDPKALSIVVILTTVRVHIEQGGGLVVAIDGKVLNNLLAYDKPKNTSIVTGYEVNSKQVLGAMPSGKGGRELQTVRELCQEIRHRWDTEDIFVTLDALHGDRKTLIELFELKMHICVTIKRNKGTLHREMHALVRRANHHGHYATSEKNRTRDESRMYQAYYRDEEISEFWQNYFKNEETVPEFGMIVVVTSFREGAEETRILYLSKVVGIELAADMIRNHWYVETKVHHSMDVSYGEDDIKVHTENAPMNLGMINRGVLNLIQRILPDARNSDKRHLASSNPLRNLAIMLNDHLSEDV